ncbi:single-stranded-DNA-specific exonuclease RecJ [Amylibacter marinus]|uniref:Single-stranded-DNA-specific exonuclease RecJ n=1 Tax=Amylibacter marinus TaxID=1475483 RepID=A0ABQ5VUQ1_9RHOB|nr:single-stranded-DNA-specific exonuclease RecJ [Amylibacter marinus]GLQ34976.1 single-stranded-DNA-specific exonuclease RecJ [Amylibacter marinus]
MTQETSEAFLNVSRSVTGRKWLGLDTATDRQAQLITQQTDLPDALARVLARLGVSVLEALPYLSPSLRDLMPDPSSLRDMDKAAERIQLAVDQGQRIAIFADYDVDGATSAALLHDWLGQLGITPIIYVPDRIDEGYGPNDAAMQKLAQSADLIICVDCGTLSHGPIAAVAGTDVVVLDHHVGGETLPDAVAVVNPNRQDESGDLAYLCAAGVVFLTLAAINRLRRTAGQVTPDLMQMLDLVALGTVADVAPLVEFNRALVRQGLKIMAGRRRIGLVALSDAARMNSTPKAYHLGYLLGPRINAGGRVGIADLGVRLLTCADPEEASAIAEKLNQLNEERREIEAQVQLQAMDQAEARGLDAPLVWAAGEGWHPGVVGIVASRLKETANRPAIVIGLDGPEGKGSGRSVSGIDLGAAIATATREGVLLKGGGHKMAAGLTVDSESLETAMSRISELLAKQGADQIGVKDLRLDGAIAPRAATVDIIEHLEQAGPYGAGASAPRFALPFLRVSFAKKVGQNHLSVTFVDDSGARISAIAFGAFDSEIGPALQNHAGKSFHIAGRLEVDDWNGRNRAKLRIEDVAFAE